MFAYRLMEREKNNVDLKEKSLELTSEGASINGDDSGFNMMIQDDTPLLLSSYKIYISCKFGYR